MRRGNARLNLLKGHEFLVVGNAQTSFRKVGSRRNLAPPIPVNEETHLLCFCWSTKHFLPAAFVRVSPNCLDHAPLTRSRADYAPALRLRGFAWERGNCLRADTRRGGPEDARHSVVWRKLELLEFSKRHQGLPSRAAKRA